MKDLVIKEIDKIKEKLFELSDQIFDNPELCYKEFFASNLLEDYLEENGFEVERGLGSVETAFRAKYSNGDSKYNIGILCEYDALPMGHGCGHQMQGPSIIGAAIAIKEAVKDLPYNLIVYGTPAEEGGGGKMKMLDEGFIKDIDVALMMHGGPATQVDVKSMAMSSRYVKFFGKSSHAALKPEAGRSAFDALLLAFQGVEFLREHVKEDTRMHYTVTTLPGPANVVPSKVEGHFSLRSYNSKYLDEIVERFNDIIKGAALMTGTTYEIREDRRLESKIPAYILNDLIMKNARKLGAPRIREAREKTGSTDFGNVTYLLPGSCARIAFVPEGTSSHSQEFLDLGKAKEARECVEFGAKIIATTVYDLIENPKLIEKQIEEFKEYKKKM
ncbi:M20 family metallopeptidase [Peptoniphilus sp. MSJ-1]|uniref:Peptidase M20 domain-containing protein 2 n=1 Tax=Peptoniphilus ovalis TaxID=2841503 RepID=A0ABS6FJ31_9FIRM|nr:M20 family metallopeptidase [Peptoniphilus ovalis]MBU5669210.1 M20 family metallopeptidase [Peptoniphilus ovalis]